MKMGSDFPLLKFVALCSSRSLRLDKASVTPCWFADVLPSATCLVTLFEKCVTQRHISQLLALSRSCYSPTTSKGQLKGNVLQRKKGKRKTKKEKDSLLVPFSVCDITGLRCLGITASQRVIFPFLLYKNPKIPWRWGRKQLCDPNPDASILERAC